MDGGRVRVPHSATACHAPGLRRYGTSLTCGFARSSHDDVLLPCRNPHSPMTLIPCAGQAALPCAKSMRWCDKAWSAIRRRNRPASAGEKGSSRDCASGGEACETARSHAMAATIKKRTPAAWSISTGAQAATPSTPASPLPRGCSPTGSRFATGTVEYAHDRRPSPAHHLALLS